MDDHDENFGPSIFLCVSMFRNGNFPTIRVFGIGMIHFRPCPNREIGPFFEVGA